MLEKESGTSIVICYIQSIVWFQGNKKMGRQHDHQKLVFFKNNQFCYSAVKGNKKFR